MSESLWSFEGTSGARPRVCSGSRRAGGRVPPLTLSAVIAAGVHLFPFRTEKLSPPAPMVLGARAPGRVGRRRISCRKGHTRGGPSAFRSGPSACLAQPAASAPSCSVRRAERPQAPDALRERRVRAEHPREPVGLERVDGVERLGRRRGRERDELGGAVEPKERVGEVVRVADSSPHRGRRRTRASATAARA